MCLNSLTFVRTAPDTSKGKMNRILSIIVTLVILFLIYLWISHLTTDPKYTRSEPAPRDRPTHVEADLTQPEDEPIQDDVRQADLSPDENDAEETETEANPKVEIEEAVQEVIEEPERTPPPAASRLQSGHFVIAGNFLERANAEKHLRRMRELGYDDAEIIRFELSEYHTVCAGRFSDPVEARRIAKRITDTHGIDTYVRAVN